MSLSAPPKKSLPRSDLLDELTLLAGCEFLSDLPLSRSRQSVLRALETIDPESFTLQAWQDTATYFCAAEPPFQTVQDARDALLAAIQKSK